MSYSLDNIKTHPAFRWSRSGGQFTSFWSVRLAQADSWPIRCIHRPGVDVRVHQNGCDLTVELRSDVQSLDPVAFTVFFSMLRDVYKMGLIEVVEGVSPSSYEGWFEGAD